MSIDSRIKLRVVATHWFSQLDAFAAEAFGDVHLRTNREHRVPSDCATDHASFVAQRNCSAGPASDRTRPAHDQRQRGIQVSAERFEFILYARGSGAISVLTISVVPISRLSLQAECHSIAISGLISASITRLLSHHPSRRLPTRLGRMTG